jgi:hypothetical protein
METNEQSMLSALRVRKLLVLAHVMNELWDVQQCMLPHAHSESTTLT